MDCPDKARFLACRDCGLLLPIAESPLAEWRATDDPTLDAYDEFVASHASHQTVQLHRHGSELRADRPLWDPLATIDFEVSDGETTYVVTGTRDSIDEPRIYRFVAGCLAVESSEVALDASDLRRGLDSQFYPHALRPTKLERFLSALRDVISQIDPDELEIAFDDADDPSVSIARMPEASYRELLARCNEIFDPWELSRIHDFLQDNRAANGLLALRVRRHLASLTA